MRYGSGDAAVVALDGVDVALDAGETVALWGPSGSGQDDAAARARRARRCRPRASVIWKGAPLSSLDAAARGAARARGIAYVFQGANLLPMFTAFENVAFAAARAGAPDRRPSARRSSCSTLVGLDGKVDHLPAELSGGEAQRVAIARALAQRPRAAALRRADRPSRLRHRRRACST